MPIEIKEMHIRMVVNVPPPGGKEPATGGQSMAQDEIVAECVEQVLQIIQNKTER